jgi:hypothetical protein
MKKMQPKPSLLEAAARKPWLLDVHLIADYVSGCVMHRTRCTLGVQTMKRARKKLVAKVGKIIKSPYPAEPEKAELRVEQADQLYREIRIENRLMDENGNEARLKEGAEVDVQIEADKHAIQKTASD